MKNYIYSVDPHVTEVKIVWGFVVMSFVMTSIPMSESMVKRVVVFFTMMVEVSVVVSVVVSMEVSMEVSVEVSMMIVVMWHGTRKVVMAKWRIYSMEWGVLKVEFIMLIVMVVESIRVIIIWVSMVTECLMVPE